MVPTRLLFTAALLLGAASAAPTSNGSGYEVSHSGEDQSQHYDNEHHETQTQYGDESTHGTEHEGIEQEHDHDGYDSGETHHSEARNGTLDADLNLYERQIPVGSVITTCNMEGVIALSFDDGPFTYTEQVLDHLAEAGMKATFFINGKNWASIYDYQSTVRRMLSDGHQVASHTMTHPDLATLSYSDVQSQMTRLEEAMLDVIGKYSTYMRHPFFSTSETSLNVMANLGYKVVHSSIDTKDWQHNTPDTIDQSISTFRGSLDEGGSICLMHDVHQTTAQDLVPAVIKIVQDRGLKAVTVGECLGDSEKNWYRTSRD